MRHAPIARVVTILAFATSLSVLATGSPAQAKSKTTTRAGGLEAGEHFRPLASAPADDDSPADHGIAYGRVLDAFTAKPIRGATVEVWSEEIDSTFGGFHRFGETRSGADGRFAVRRWSGGNQGEKARILADGYLTRSATAGDLYGVVRLFPARKEPFRVKVLDAQGRPIADARITTTYSCSHDLPAFDVRTDARGVATCPTFGLQHRVPELRVRALGYAAIEYLDADRALGRGASAPPLTVHLPRRRSFSVRLLDRAGQVIADAPIRVIDDECYHVIRTTKRGTLRVDARYGNDAVGLEMLLEPRYGFIAHFAPPRGRVVTLRRHPEDWPEETPVGKVRIDWGGRDPEKEDAVLQLFHEGGWYRDLDRPVTGPIPFPSGAGFLVVGGPFRGHAQEIHDFALAPNGEVIVRPAFVREPRVTVKGVTVGDATVKGDVWIEAGADTLEDVKPGTSVSVPAGRPLCVFHEGDTRSLRLVSPPVKDGAVLDLAHAEKIGPVAAAHSPIVQEVHCFSSDGGQLEGRLELQGGHADCRALPTGSDAAGGPGPARHITGPSGATWLARFTADGHEPIWIRGTLDGGAPLTRVVPRSASVRVEAPSAFRVLGYDADDLESLAPGPLDLVIARNDGRRYALELTLKPGARRVIKIVDAP